MSAPKKAQGGKKAPGGKSGIEPLTVSPKAFANAARKINELVAAVNAMAGTKNLSAVVPLELVSSDENSILSLDLKTLAAQLRKIAVGTAAGGGSSGTAIAGAEGAAIDVVGTDGKLNKVPKHSSWASPAAYPTLLAIANGTNTVELKSTGLVITTSGGKICSILFSAVARDITIRTISVCDSGTVKSMDVLASAPY